MESCALLFFSFVQIADAPPAPVPALEKIYDFRTGAPLPPDIRPAGALHLATLRPEIEGFRITLSAAQPNPVGRAGLEMNTAIGGDFEISAGYEILHADEPSSGVGVGFEFFVHTVHTPQQGLGIYRLKRPNDGDVYFVSRNFIDDQGKPGWKQKQFRSEASAGRVKITRSGSQATAWASDGKAAPLKQLITYDLGSDDIKVIWLMAYSGHAQQAVDLRVTDLKIVSGTPIPFVPASDADRFETGPTVRTMTWRISLLAAFLLLLGIGAAWLCRRKRRESDGGGTGNS